MDSNKYVEEEHWSLVATLTHMRVAFGHMRGHVAYSKKRSALHEDTSRTVHCGRGRIELITYLREHRFGGVLSQGGSCLEGVSPWGLDKPYFDTCTSLYCRVLYVSLSCWLLVWT
jgi:hypothetical protein